MKCNDMQYMISAYVDNELTAEETAAVKSHIEQCKKCRAFYEDLKKVKNIMPASGNRQVSADFTDNVMNKIYSGSKTVKSNIYMLHVRKYFYAAAAFLFVVTGSVFYMMNSRPFDDTWTDPAELFELYDDSVQSENIYDGDIVSFLYI